MRVEKRALKGGEGEITLVPETLDDLWHLKYIIEPGDFVISVTKRAVNVTTDKIRPEKVEKQTVRLGISVEKVMFHRFANRLRVSGIIKYGPDMGAHHTLNIEPMTAVSIIKRWRREQLNRILEAEEASNRPSVLILTIEEGLATLASVRQFGVDELFSITKSYGKDRGGVRQDFFAEVLSALHAIAPDIEVLVVAGPGFTKDDFLKYIVENEPALAEKVITEGASSCGLPGYLEVLRRGAVERASKNIRLSREARLIETLLERISKNEPVVYGLNEVKSAVEFGAVDTLMVADELLREQREKWNIDSLLQRVESTRGEVVVFSSEFEPGKRLVHMGGIVALLRFPI